MRKSLLIVVLSSVMLGCGGETSTTTEPASSAVAPSADAGTTPVTSPGGPTEP